MDMRTLINTQALTRITNRNTDLDNIRAMLDGEYEPQNGLITPPFEPGSGRELAWRRALRTTTTTVPFIIDKRLGSLDFGNITWSDATPQAEELINELDLADLAHNLAQDFHVTGVAVGMASEPLIFEPNDDNTEKSEPIIATLSGVNMPYSVPHDPNRIVGWYRAFQYADTVLGGQLRWWVETYDWQNTNPDVTIHRVWRSLRTPTELALTPDDEFESGARPRFALYGRTPDGLPRSPILAGMGRIMGLYSTELRLAASEELAAFPILLLRGNPEYNEISPAEVVTADSDGGAEWVDPGKLEELREQIKLKRDQLRETFNLPGGALGNQTPSGEALQEANRGFMQEAQKTADAVSHVLTHTVQDYLELHGIQNGVGRVSLPIDRAYMTNALSEIVETGVDLGAIPTGVAARLFQQFLGNSAYSDDELAEFLDEIAARRSVSIPGFLPRSDEPE